jgi:hypothetical protein
MCRAATRHSDKELGKFKFNDDDDDDDDDDDE